METINFGPSAIAHGLGRKYEGDDGFVYRPAKVFECGDYPDKGFSLTEQEADEAIRDFQSAPNNIEHRRSVLDNLIGTTVGLYRRGKDIIGNLRIPKELDALLGDAPIPLSAEWSPEPKRYKGTALTVNPRVLSAAAHAFTTSPDFKTFAASNPTEAAELVTEASKAPVPANPMPLTKEQIKDAAWTTFSADPQNAGVKREEFEAAFSTAPVVPAQTVTVDPAIQAQIDDIKMTQETQGAAFAAQKDADDAAAFYLEELKSGRAAPAEEADVKAQFSTARKADRLGKVTFSAAESDETALRKRFSARPVKFALGGPFLDSSLQPKFSEGLGIFSDSDFKTPSEAK